MKHLKTTTLDAKESREEEIREMIKNQYVIAHRERALKPENPIIKGTAQHPDVFFQPREAVNSYYLASPGIVQKVMGRFAKLTERSYHLFDYSGAEDVERVIVKMGASKETPHGTVKTLNKKGEKTKRDVDPFEVDFIGLGSDESLNTNNSTIKINEEKTENYEQVYFNYDSIKSREMTTLHLRFGEKIIRSTYPIENALFLLNAPRPKDQVWDFLPRKEQKQIIKKDLQLYCIDVNNVARENGVEDQINTVIQACFFDFSNILNRETTILQNNKAINKTVGIKEREVTESNYTAEDHALTNLYKVEIPNENSGADTLTSSRSMRAVVPETAPEFVHKMVA